MSLVSRCKWPITGSEIPGKGGSGGEYVRFLSNIQHARDTNVAARIAVVNQFSPNPPTEYMVGKVFPLLSLKSQDRYYRKRVFKMASPFYQSMRNLVCRRSMSGKTCLRLVEILGLPVTMTGNFCNILLYIQ